MCRSFSIVHDVWSDRQADTLTRQEMTRDGQLWALLSVWLSSRLSSDLQSALRESIAARPRHAAISAYARWLSPSGQFGYLVDSSYRRSDLVGKLLSAFGDVVAVETVRDAEPGEVRS